MSKDQHVMYEHLDPDGDQLRVVSETRGGLPHLRFAIRMNESQSSLVDLNAAAVNHLHALLGAWLADNGITQRASVGLAPKPLSVTDVRTIVRHEISTWESRFLASTVVPLHQSPLAVVNPDPEGPEYCGCSEYSDGRLHFAHDPQPESEYKDVSHPVDPEPHDVGHPDAGPCGIDPVPRTRCCLGCTPGYVPEPDAEEGWQ